MHHHIDVNMCVNININIMIKRGRLRKGSEEVLGQPLRGGSLSKTKNNNYWAQGLCSIGRRNIFYEKVTGEQHSNRMKATTVVRTKV